MVLSNVENNKYSSEGRQYPLIISQMTLNTFWSSHHRVLQYLNSKTFQEGCPTNGQSSNFFFAKPVIKLNLK
jgi:hypothetical protein